MAESINYQWDPEEDDIDQEAEDDRNEIRVGNDFGEPDPEDTDLLEDPLFAENDEDDDE